jgi:hypothetical protein
MKTEVDDKAVVTSLSIPSNIKGEAVRLARSNGKSFSSFVTELLIREIKLNNQQQIKNEEKSENLGMGG